MRLLIDQDVYQGTVNELRQRGHDAITVKDLQMEQASDERLLVEARR